MLLFLKYVFFIPLYTYIYVQSNCNLKVLSRSYFVTGDGGVLSQGFKLYYSLFARDETLEKISNDSSTLSLIRRLLQRVYVTETHDPSGRDVRRDFNREYPDLTVPGYVPG